MTDRECVARRSERGKTYVSSGSLLASRVTHLVVRRPPLFHFTAGDYVFVNVPAIAAYEWHPFTISSAPDQPGEHRKLQTPIFYPLRKPIRPQRQTQKEMSG